MAAASPIEMPSVETLLAAATPKLSGASGTPRLDAELLLAFATGTARSFILAFPERGISAEAHTCFENALARRARGEPLAYIIGRKEFFSLELHVSPAVLIPRPDTEIMVDEVLARFGPAAAFSVLDLGTGSGALALAIKKHRPNADVWAADASRAALEVAEGNAQRLDVDVRFVASDWFAALEARRFDAIVCNPPYVRAADAALDGALKFEPRLALDGGADGLEALRTLLGESPPHLRAGGLLMIEHGHDQQREVLELAGAAGFETLAAKRDLAGHERMVVLRSSRS